MEKLIVAQKGRGHATAETADLWDSFVVHRIDREFIGSTPEVAGIYLLFGADSKGKVAAYVGKSTTNLRRRLGSHKKNPKKDWFGTVYVVPIPDPGICSPVEAELIAGLEEANVVKVKGNKQSESRFLESTDIHVDECVEKIKAGIELLIGSPIFSGEVETDESGKKTLAVDSNSKSLSRTYRGQAAKSRPRTSDDLPKATHSWIGAGIQAWGHFVGSEPDKRFVVLKNSSWRVPNIDPSQTTYDLQVKLKAEQDKMVKEGVLDLSSMTLRKDHTFDNWTRAARVVSGKAQYAGAYHWQRVLGKAATND